MGRTAADPVEQERMEFLRALIDINDELAALFPNPDNPLFQNAQAICSGKSDADAQCILNAFLIGRRILERDR